ncbi:17261_t:CDS:10, partial [Funneliformis caledonium]
GIVLWSKSFTRITSSPVDALIKDVLIEERAGENSYIKDSYSLKWTFANELDLIFVAAYQKILQLAYIEELLATVKKFFCDKFAEHIRNTSSIHKYAFDDDFNTIFNNIEEKDSKGYDKLSKPRPFEQTKKFKETIEGSKKLSVNDITKPPTIPIISDDKIARNIEAIRGKPTRGRGGRTKSRSSKPSNESSSDDKKPTRKKTLRTWEDKISKDEMESLDYSGNKDDTDRSSAVNTHNLVDQNQFGQFQDGHYEVQDLGQNDSDKSEEDDYDEENEESNKNDSQSSVFSFFRNITGQKEITQQDLVPALAKMKEHLIKKNVAADIATHLCDSVARNLVGQKTGSFKISLKRILTPKTSVDLLRDIAQAQSESRPYTICFIGVNGVGKCFARGTKFLMYDGTYKNVEELTVGNQIMGDDNSPRTIQSTTRGEGSMYRIFPNDKGPAEPFECNDQHILVLKFAANPFIQSGEIPITGFHPRIRLFWYEYDEVNNMIVKKTDSYYYGPGKLYLKKEAAKKAAIQDMARKPNLAITDFIWEVPVKDFLTASYDVRRNCLMFKPSKVIFKVAQGKFRIILSEILGIDPTDSQISAAAWLVGAWISNGLETSPTICVNENEIEIVKAMEKHGETLNWKCIKDNSNKEQQRISFIHGSGFESEFLRLLRMLDILDAKKVPPVIMTDELDQVRLPLLAGILDIGGHLLEKQKGSYEYIYQSPQKRCNIVEQVRNLANLSGFCSINVKRSMKEVSNNITAPYFYTTITGNELDKLPLIVSRKKVCKHRDCNLKLDNRDMVWSFKVVNVGLGPYYGFKVDKNERFLLADLTVAHNSTNLSKTCFWLLQNGLKVLIAACDTFRSGAVEQLRVHVRNLNALGQNSTVELYERGYGKDAAGIAKDAVNYAKANKFDVVLIDTAGRMQDNEPLMRALAKLVSVNNPDKIIFVGEALVGNEAVDQLTKFNQALKDFSGLQNPRQIDGMILTKFDTIDDKVGAALSMTYTTGQPILFVGTGQTYTDLKNMRVGHIVHALLRE